MKRGRVFAKKLDCARTLRGDAPNRGFMKSLFFLLFFLRARSVNAINWPTGRGVTYLFVHRMTNAANLTAKARPAFLS